MKPSLLLAVLLLSACGQSGELYLPDNPPPAELKRQQRAEKQKAAPAPAAETQTPTPAPAPN